MWRRGRDLSPSNVSGSRYALILEVAPVINGQLPPFEHSNARTRRRSGPWNPVCLWRFDSDSPTTVTHYDASQQHILLPNALSRYRVTAPGCRGFERGNHQYQSDLRATAGGWKRLHRELLVGDRDAEWRRLPRRYLRPGRTRLMGGQLHVYVRVT